MTSSAPATEKGHSGLSSEQLESFDRDGFLVVEDAIDIEAYLDPMIEEFTAVLEYLVRDLRKQGRLSSAYADLPFNERLTRVYEEIGTEVAQHFDFSLPFKRQTRPDEPCHFGPRVFAMLRNPSILDKIESVIGGEILSNPVQHLRVKPPARFVSPEALQRDGGLIGATPWHQDASVVTPDADETPIITVWMPITDASEENGCLLVAPRNHKVGLLKHCLSATRGKYLPEELFDIDRARPLPMRRGSMLMMSRMTPHGSLTNHSDMVRCSMDLRYSPAGLPTGRTEFPAFVARSHRDPSSELRNAEEWKRQWLATRVHLAANPQLVGTFQRWQEGACA